MGSNKMKLDKLINLYKDMKNNNIERYRFDYQNGKGIFDIFFFIDETPFILLFGAKGANFSFEIEVKNGFNIDINLDKDTYKKLIEFLGIKYAKGNPFSTFKFFEDFNTKIPDIAKKSNIAKPQQIINYRNNVEESEKIYFWKWLDNTKQGNQVSNENLEKTRKLLGVKAYERCKKKNISSCWTDDKNKEKAFVLP